MNRLAIALAVTACSATVAAAGDWGYGGGYGPAYRSYDGPYVTSVYESRPYTTSVHVTEDYPWYDTAYAYHGPRYDAPRHYEPRYAPPYDEARHRYGYHWDGYGYRFYTSRRTCVENRGGASVVVFCDRW